MKNILTTRENKGLSFNSIFQTRAYSGKDSNSNLKFNPNNSKNLIRQIQLSRLRRLKYPFGVPLRGKLKSFFGGAGTITIPSSRKDARLKITALNQIFKFIIPHFKQYPLHYRV